MSATNYDSRTADKFVVRLPDGLRAAIEAAANDDDRSMNSVFVKATRQYLDGQKRQQILLDALANTVTTPMMSAAAQGSSPYFRPLHLITENSVVAESMHIDDRARMVGDPRDLFIAANPCGASTEELKKGRGAFIDGKTQADYLIFLAGYRAAISAAKLVVEVAPFETAQTDEGHHQ